MLKTTQGLIRIFLGVSFLFYGVVKVAGGQFKYDGFVLDSQTTDGTTMVLCFYGYSPIYGRLIGLAEIIPALLLLIPRTLTLGALLLLPIAANITVLDFCFDFPAVKFFALFLTVLDLCLLAADSRKLILLFRIVVLSEQRLGQVETALKTSKSAPSSAAPTGKRGSSRKALRVRRGVLTGVYILVALFLANCLMAALTNPVEASIDFCVQRGRDRHELLVRRWVMTSGWSGLGRQGIVEFQVKDTTPAQRIQLTVEQPHAFAAWRIHEDK